MVVSSAIFNEGEFQVFTDSELTKKIVDAAALLGTGIWLLRPCVTFSNFDPLMVHALNSNF